MARQTITVTTSARTGVSPTTYTGLAADGLQFDNSDQNVLILAANDTGSSVNVTFITDRVVDENLAVDDRVVAVATGTEKIFGPFNNTDYGGTDSIVSIDVSADGVVFRAVKMGAL